MGGSINKDYKGLLCYKKMREEDKEKFDVLAAHYGEILNRGPKRGITLYTSHDFDSHCFDLYRIISLYLLGEAGLNSLNYEELYLLNLSVLLHDISMCKGGFENGAQTVFDRKIHALQSAQWIRKEYGSSQSHLHNSKLSQSQIEMICDICQAHSDLKGRDEPPSGLSNPKLEFEKQGTIEKIRVKALAGILRMADELDVTSHRLIDSDEMNSLLTAAADDGRPEVQAFIREDKESRKHFRRLQLICELEPSKDDITAIVLKLDTAQVEKRLEQGDEGNLAEDLREIRNKIQKELDGLWNKVLTKPDAKAGGLTTLKRVVWDNENIELIERLLPDEVLEQPVDIDSVSSLKSVSSKQTEEGSKKLEDEETENMPEDAGSGEGKIKLLDEILSQRLKEYVYAQHMLSVGHYQLNATYCARDWISTSEVLDNTELAGQIVHVVSQHISDSFGGEDFTIVGLDLAGTRVAAQLGFTLQCPFTYVIPAHQYDQVDAHEVRVPGIPERSKIVLVTDCIITGLTILQIIRENGWEDRVVAIYTVFYREPQYMQVEDKCQFPCIVYALNRNFPAEISLVSRCPYGGNGNNCKALNRKL